MYGRKKKILVKSSGGSCSLIFEHSNNNLTSGLTTPSLSLIERIFYMCLLYSTFPSAVYGKKTSNSNNVRRRNVSALRTRKTGLASCWTRLGRSDWPGRNVSACFLHDDPFSSSYHYLSYLLSLLANCCWTTPDWADQTSWCWECLLASLSSRQEQISVQLVCKYNNG